MNYGGTIYGSEVADCSLSIVVAIGSVDDGGLHTVKKTLEEEDVSSCLRPISMGDA
ncbi:hypothetical protein SESBI_43443 [Sesbania bispinosa]|nr:hypothetical protein SESBI_43443 [Sesbania bispinosa]